MHAFSTLRSYIHDIEHAALGDPTAVTVSFETGCDHDSNTETDVAWWEGQIDGPVRGQTFCEDFDTHCDQFFVTIDYNYIVQNSDPDPENVKKTICHELGHTVGLTHGSEYGGCMVSGAVNGDVQWRRYASHHRNHINAWFGD